MWRERKERKKIVSCHLNAQIYIFSVRQDLNYFSLNWHGAFAITVENICIYICIYLYMPDISINSCCFTAIDQFFLLLLKSVRFLSNIHSHTFKYIIHFLLIRYEICRICISQILTILTFSFPEPSNTSIFIMRFNISTRIVIFI